VGASHEWRGTKLGHGEVWRWGWQDPLPTHPTWVPGADGDTGTTPPEPALPFKLANPRC